MAPSLAYKHNYNFLLEGSALFVCLEVNGADVTLCVCVLVFLEKTAFLGCIVAFFATDVPSEEAGPRDRSPPL